LRKARFLACGYCNQTWGDHSRNANCSITITNKQNHNVFDYDYVESNHDYKYKLEANCEKFDSKFKELRTPDGCASSGMAVWKGTERLAN